ncbi:TPA: hypothetical protein ACOJQP_003564 [Vibrio harveyi]|nr:hypothetical protein [Vibrio harveyi]
MSKRGDKYLRTLLVRSARVTIPPNFKNAYYAFSFDTPNLINS